MVLNRMECERSGNGMLVKLADLHQNHRFRTMSRKITVELNMLCCAQIVTPGSHVVLNTNNCSACTEAF